MVGERTVALGPTEYRMLEFFMTHPERVYTRDQLLDRIWGGNVYVEERTIDVHIRRLRKALEDSGTIASYRRSAARVIVSRAHHLGALHPRVVTDATGDTGMGVRGGSVARTVVIGCGAGWLFGNPFGGLAAALALHLAWVLANLARLDGGCATAITPTRPTSAGVGRDHRADRAPAPPQALPQTALRAAHAPVAALHRGAAERCRHPQRAARDHVVQPHGGAGC